MKQFTPVLTNWQFQLALSYYEWFTEKEIKDGFDFTIPPIERVPVQPSFQSLASGNWGTQWHETKDNAQWIRDNAKRKVAVFVLDTGAGFSNSRMDAAWWKGKEKIFTGESRGVDTQGHSTHVSSSIGGVDQNKPIGAAEELVKMGLLKIIPYKVLNDQGSGRTTWIVEGMDAAVEEAKQLEKEGWFCIINMSLGGRGQSAAMDAASKRATDAGVMVVCAAGNGGSNQIGTPANGPDALAVAAHDAGGKRANFSDYGDDMESAGAGVGILGLLPNESEASYSGTSMAAPHVSAISAIIASCYPDLALEGVKAVLFSRVHDIDPEGWDMFTGHGSFKLGKLIAQPVNPDNPDTPDGPDTPDNPDTPQPPVDFISTVELELSGYEFRYRLVQGGDYRVMKIDNLIVEVIAKGTEETVHDLAKQVVQDYFDFTAMAIPDDPAFGYATVAWWIGQFLEYQARQKSVGLQVLSLKGTDDKGRVALASGFDKAGFRKATGGAIPIKLD